ncbi:Uu.00g107790.m01.CDS01 [Anthostomella pinea]|uniref:Uu.00g107790.m01.CDS01 n=1 Tax=Anthostomella pinea TaxID=933095 RepID=A0AAI8VEG5_9PEZI|nr:Uu.00g107790.m01.CDS01 [Anthostomella pinea]
MNENKVGPYLKGDESRVLEIRGRAEYVNEAYLVRFLQDRVGIYWHTDEFVLVEGGQENTVRWSFASCRAQAKRAFNGLSLHDGMTVNNGVDPCS